MSISSLRSFLRFFTPNYFSKKTLFLSSCLNELEKDEERQVFLYKFKDGEACVKYKRLDGVYDLEHTIVPEKFRGCGIGVSLAQNDYCLRNNLKVKVSCTYLQRYYAENAERYRRIVIT
ncbi:hypothetical protein O3M35_010873 [Rhynocoris fuscipes]|uniref:Protein NATD1 n=1 Tax=Rhynocoris fuscipes TaxID=488301 RepID=A0AAW1D495_9HEMI